MKENIYIQTKIIMEEMGEKANLQKGNVFVVGCSTSEVTGAKIGTNSSPEVAKLLFDALYDYAKEKGIYLAIQCCEHLNRAIIVEKEAVPFAEMVNVVPQPKAGGSLATAAYHGFTHPVVVEEIKADAGIDIGLPDPVHCPPDKARKVLDKLKPKKFVLAHYGAWKQWDEVYEYLAGADAKLGGLD